MPDHELQRHTRLSPSVDAHQSPENLKSVQLATCPLLGPYAGLRTHLPSTLSRKRVDCMGAWRIVTQTSTSTSSNAEQCSLAPPPMKGGPHA